jgi:hypothetical protein
MPRARILVLVAALITASCYGVLPDLSTRRRQPQCDAMMARLQRDAQALPAAGGLRFEPRMLTVERFCPHCDHICWDAGLAPVGWTHHEEAHPDGIYVPRHEWTAPASDDGAASLRHALTGPDRSFTIPAFIEGRELAPARGRGLVQRESSGRSADGREHRRVLVTREAGALHLRVLRWSAVEDDDNWYLRCEATLTGKYEATLPVFEAVCDSARVRHWDYGW